jgi:hypothetical protein
MPMNKVAPQVGKSATEMPSRQSHLKSTARKCVPLQGSRDERLPSRHFCCKLMLCPRGWAYFLRLNVLAAWSLGRDHRCGPRRFRRGHRRLSTARCRARSPTGAVLHISRGIASIGADRNRESRERTNRCPRPRCPSCSSPANEVWNLIGSANNPVWPGFLWAAGGLGRNHVIADRILDQVGVSSGSKHFHDSVLVICDSPRRHV